MTKIYIVLFSVICLLSCGTTGHVTFYNFNASKNQIEKKLQQVIQQTYSVPKKWSDIYQNPGPIEYFYVYFSNSPEEMYQIGFTDKENWNNSTKCQLGLVGVFNGDHWQYENELSNIEKKRISGRFEKEILSKLEHSYSISY